MKKSLNRKKFLTAVLLLLAVVGAWAQSPDLFFEQAFPYQTISNYPFSDRPYCYVTEVPPNNESEGYCLFTVNHGKSCSDSETQPVSPTLIYKLSMQGELLGQLTIGYDDRTAFVCAVYQAPDDPTCFLAVGYVHDNDFHYDRPLLARFDQNLNLLWRREVELPEPYRNTLSFSSLMDSEGNILCSSYLLDCNNPLAYFNGEFSRFVFRLTPEGELDGINDLPLVSYLQKVFEFSDGSGDYGLLETIGTDPNLSELVLLRINRNLEIVSQRTIPERYEVMDPTNTYPKMTFILFPSGRERKLAMAPLPNGSMILANEADVSYQKKDAQYEYYYGLGLLWVNPEGEAVSCVMDWNEQSHDSLVMIVPMMPIFENSFYFVYTMRQASVFSYANCFVVGKRDLEGNLLWKRYWNRHIPEYGMKVYYPEEIVTSHDGGCLITGQSFEDEFFADSTYVYQPDVFLLKFFADGTLAVPETADISIRPYGLFPNPVEDVLHLEYSPDVAPRQVALYDLLGHILYTQNNDLENISMRQLPAGTYTLHITMEDGNAYSERVVKR